MLCKLPMAVREEKALAPRRELGASKRQRYKKRVAPLSKVDSLHGAILRDWYPTISRRTRVFGVAWREAAAISFELKRKLHTDVEFGLLQRV
jgi:hypothetical protein